jgi:hypothetical protein
MHANEGQSQASIDLTDHFSAQLARNTSPDPSVLGARLPACYHVAALYHHGRVLLTLTLLREHAYCCAEWGCHMGGWSDANWHQLRAVIEARGQAASPCLTIDLTVVVQAGARCYDFMRPIRGHTGEYEFTPQSAGAYTHQLCEDTA